MSGSNTPSRIALGVLQALDRYAAHSASQSTSRVDPGAEPSKYPWEDDELLRYAEEKRSKLSAFEEKYPEDEFGREAQENARVWQVYRDHALEDDQHQLRGWNNTLDILLLFAALFSAVLTAFLIESFKNLQPDYTEYLATAVFASLQRANTSVPDIQLLQSPTSFVAPKAARWTSGLWLISLIVALFVAFLSILAKQWLDDYETRVAAPSASVRSWAIRHAAYKKGLKKWLVADFLSTLPVLLHFSVMVFLSGLVFYLWNLDRVVAYIVLSLSICLLGFYLAAMLMPLWKGDCPTVTPLLRQVRFTWVTSRGIAHSLRVAWRVLRRRIIRNPRQDEDLEQSHFEEGVVEKSTLTKPVAEPLEPAFHEARLVRGNEELLAAGVLTWMSTSLLATDDVGVALDAIGGLNPFDDRYNSLRSTAIQDRISDRFRVICRNGHRSTESVTAARWLRSLLFVQSNAEEITSRDKKRLESALSYWRDKKTHDLHFLASFATRLTTGRSSPREWEEALSTIREWTQERKDETFTTSILPGEYMRKPDGRPPTWPHLHSSSALIMSSSHFDSLSGLITLLHAQQPWACLVDAEDNPDAVRMYLQRFEEMCDREFTSHDQSSPAAAAWAERLLKTTPFDRWIAIWDALLCHHQSFGLHIDDIVLIFEDYIDMIRCQRSIVGAFAGQFQTVECIMGWIATAEFKNGDYPDAVQPAMVLLSAAFTPPKTSSRFTYWSNTFNIICNHLLRQLSRRPSDPDNDFDDSLVAFVLQCMYNASRLCVASILHIEDHPSRDDAMKHGFVNVLCPSPFDLNTPSTWRLIAEDPILDADYFGEQERFEKLGKSVAALCAQLCFLKRHGANVTAHFSELFARTNAVDLLRFSPSHRLAIALHCKEISPEWWNETAPILNQLDVAAWTRNSVQPISPKVFVSRIDQTQSCTDCVNRPLPKLWCQAA
ncbi:hypothetical protein BKA62DRAFT_718412 [Auriculariales sp. MPI-PUGE-AT-0066]|nr:hypothetical protein BKA62DRAFT_718412 [Auriculariales sp. MPI-PUGE-AT-0066]